MQLRVAVMHTVRLASARSIGVEDSALLVASAMHESTYYGLDVVLCFLDLKKVYDHTPRQHLL